MNQLRNALDTTIDLNDGQIDPNRVQAISNMKAICLEKTRYSEYDKVLAHAYMYLSWAAFETNWRTRFNRTGTAIRLFMVLRRRAYRAYRDRYNLSDNDEDDSETREESDDQGSSQEAAHGATQGAAQAQQGPGFQAINQPQPQPQQQVNAAPWGVPINQPQQPQQPPAFPPPSFQFRYEGELAELRRRRKQLYKWEYLR